MMTVYDFEERLFMAVKRRVTDDDMAEYRRLTSSVDRDMQLDRKTAALIIHEFLYDVLKEPDEEDISPAFELEDIYECRVCAMHIAQVYSKGIANASHYFDLKRTVSEDEAVKMAKLTNGYAYAYQVLGYLLWNSNTKTISKKILSEYDYYLKSFVYDKIWEGLSSKEIEILQSVSESSDINEIIEKIGMDKKTFSVYRDRLIKYGVLISKQRGKVTFALPRFKEYIRNVFLFD